MCENASFGFVARRPEPTLWGKDWDLLPRLCLGQADNRGEHPVSGCALLHSAPVDLNRGPGQSNMAGMAAITKKVGSRTPPVAEMSKCGRGFTSSVGQDYSGDQEVIDSWVTCGGLIGPPKA
ncbi:hypothetical protein BDZ97DRAFT_1764805 [Flammula alnicola]|nr:hypothetical protein BDZ97DRAFT_1764805 [Flammula alnicola]